MNIYAFVTLQNVVFMTKFKCNQSFTHYVYLQINHS